MPELRNGPSVPPVSLRGRRNRAQLVGAKGDLNPKRRLVGVEEELARLGSDGESSRDRALGLGELARELLCLRKENEECRRAGLVPRLGREYVCGGQPAFRRLCFVGSR